MIHIHVILALDNIIYSDDVENTNDTDGDSDTEKEVFDEKSQIEMISMENGRNDHTFTFGGNGNYDDGIYCSTK